MQLLAHSAETFAQFASRFAVVVVAVRHVTATRAACYVRAIHLHCIIRAGKGHREQRSLIFANDR